MHVETTVRQAVAVELIQVQADVARVGENIGDLDTRLAGLDGRLAGLNTRFDAADASREEMKGTLDRSNQRLIGLQRTQRLASILFVRWPSSLILVVGQQPCSRQGRSVARDS